MSTRAHTPDERTADEDGRTWTRVTVQRCCNGCGQKLGDATDAEIQAGVEGQPLPDVRGECPACQDIEPCPFCELLADGSRPLTHDWGSAVAFEPLDPIVAGHLLVIPREHVVDASVDPLVTADVMANAAQVAAEKWPCNVITSCGAGATQSVFHLHVHIVPRHEDDGLLLPWSGVEVRQDRDILRETVLNLDDAVEQARRIACALEAENAEQAVTIAQLSAGLLAMHAAAGDLP
jgi:histidine triad (HIT) family protein